MKVLLLTLMVSITLIACAIPHKTVVGENKTVVQENPIQIPYGEPTSKMYDRLSQKDTTLCGIRANIGHDALTHAKKNVELQEARQSLGKLLFSLEFEMAGITGAEIQFLSSILDFAYALHKNHAKITPIQFGDKIWKSCIYEKSAIHV